jgi:F-type H+-transporting ATPase subunit gamma
MASIRQYRKKIKSAKNIVKITRAMQMVAASKMKRAQDAALKGRAYSDGIRSLSSMLSRYIDHSTHPLLLSNLGRTGKELVLIVAPEKGLCGGLITDLARFVHKVYTDIDISSSQFIVVGKKAKNIVNMFGGSIIAEFSFGTGMPKYEVTPPLAKFIEEKFISGEVDNVKVIFSEFVNTTTQKPVQKLLLPLNVIEEKEVVQSYSEDFLFEPSIKEIADPLLEMYMEIGIYQILLESYASEQSARMVAMKNATDNAQSLTNVLNLEYNKSRQAGITSEIIDMGRSSEV